MTITHLNPDTLHKNPAFTQVVVIENPTRFIYIGGQNGVNAQGEIVGDDIASQSAQTMQNISAALEAAGATWNEVFKMTIYIVQGQSLHDAFAAAQPFQSADAKPPTVSVIQVAGLANPRFLIEIEVVAAQ